MPIRVDYDRRIFQPVTPPSIGVNDATGVVPDPPPAGDAGPETRFQYHQHGDVVWATYAGGDIRFGTLIATQNDEGGLDARYQQVTSDGTIKSGRCRSTPEFLHDGRLRLHEEWVWTEGASGSGSSVVEEL